MKRTLIIVVTTIIAITGAMTPITIDISSKAYANEQQIATFPDIQGHWAQKEIEFVLEQKLMSGHKDGTFKPNEPVTRAQLSEPLAGLADIYSWSGLYPNLNGHWAEDYIEKLATHDIISTEEHPEKYEADVKASRIETAKMVSRLLIYKSPKWKEVLNGYERTAVINLPIKDTKTLTQSDYPYVAFIMSTGLMGSQDGLFKRNGVVTKAELAVIIKRFYDLKDQTPNKEELINKFKGNKALHSYTKEEMERWVDREADFERLRKIPIVNLQWGNSLKKYNDMVLENDSFLDEYKMVKDNYYSPAHGYMNTFYNYNYQTITVQYKTDLSYYIRGDQTYKGVKYTTAKTLPKYFDVIVKDIKKNKQISESVFVSDVTMYYQYDDATAEELKEAERISKKPGYQYYRTPSETFDRVRGTQYIRFSSGTDLPKGVKLNKWYKRDVEVQLFAPMNFHRVSWDTSYWVFDKIIPLNSYKEVKPL